MKGFVNVLLFLFLFSTLGSCNKPKYQKLKEPRKAQAVINYNDVTVVPNGPHKLISAKHLLHQLPAQNKKGLVNVVVEIPAGTLQKWEVNKKSGGIDWDFKDGKPRTVNFLGYPGNYGMIPQTLLPKSEGGDGDPLDVLVLGAPAPRGSVVSVKIIGVLLLKDNGEMDDKLIAVLKGSPLDFANRLEDLNKFNPKILQIVELWFTGYKGGTKIISAGYGPKEKAMQILKASKQGYEAANKDNH